MKRVVARGSRHSIPAVSAAVVTCTLMIALPMKAWADPFGQGRILGTGGVTTVSGAAGGGIVPWALIAGYGTNEQTAFTAFYTNVQTPNFALNAYGAAVGIDNRVELSIARQGLGLGNTGPNLDAALGAPVFGSNYVFNQDIVGAKVRLFGDAVYDQDRWLPQVAIGMQYHHNQNGSLVRALGAKPYGTSYYLSGTKVFLDGLFGRTTVVDVNLDLTRANQNGLLGFGGINGDRYRLEPQVSAGVFLNRRVVLGGEYRAMPQYQLLANNALGNAVSKTSDWKDVYLAYFPSKSVSVTVAYAMLGQIASIPNQTGPYASFTASF